MPPTPLADAYLGACDRRCEDRAALDAHLEALAGNAPFAIEAERLCAALARVDRDPLALDAAAADEVALALACGDGDAAAHACFEEKYVSIVPAAVAHLRLDAADIDEVRQVVRARLLVGAPPRILEYAGLGTLRGLVKVVAVRAALDRLRKLGRDAGDGALRELPAPDHDPELAFLEARSRAAFSSALEEAFRSLEARERNLLRLHHLDGATLEDLATLYGVHRATVVRQLAKAREHVLSSTRKALRRELAVADLESVIGLLRSRFELSIERMLRTSERE